MKKFLILILIGFCGFFYAKAQDVIVLKNTEEIQAKILEILPTTIKYVEWDFQDGPARFVDKRDIFVVKYRNGQKEVFNVLVDDAPAQEDTSNYGGHGKINKIKAQGYVYLGTPIEANGAGPAADISFGARFYDYFYLGGEVSYACVFEKYGYYRISMHLVSLNANMKGYWPVSEKFFPFLNLSIGMCLFPVEGMAWFNMQVGPGFDFKRLSVGIGYHLLSKYGINVHMDYFKIGVRL